MNIRLICFVFLLGSSSAFGQAVQLITADEAKQPAAAAKPASRAITRGPAVKLLSPESVSGQFPFKIGFEPRGESKIDTASIKVEYLKGPGVDLTERLKSGIKPAGIEIPAAAAPAGEHPIRVTVRDSEGRMGTAEFKLTVK
ncbi:MAG: hypothetical protein A2W21_06215 [Betaproteobacteria bacterium RBG_16_66_20]|nr:MAG: hypothetical protein A2W21_06215 [Betaproteobacteria bacterium RBG_16_66_20]